MRHEAADEFGPFDSSCVWHLATTHAIKVFNTQYACAARMSRKTDTARYSTVPGTEFSQEAGAGAWTKAHTQTLNKAGESRRVNIWDFTRLHNAS